VSAGSYTVTLTVTDNKGATSSDTAAATILNRAPIANAGSDRTGAQGAAIALDGSGSSDPDGRIVAWAWTFGDGATGTGSTPSHAYAAPGTYTAQLTVTDDKSSTASDTVAVTVTAATATPWARRIGASAADNANDVAVDANGNVVVAGVIRGSVDVGGKSLTSAGGADAFVAKYAPNGALVWARSLGGTGDDEMTSVAVAANGDVVVTGRFAGNVSFGGATLQASGASDIVLAKYAAADGAHLWSKRFGGTMDDSGSAVAIDGSGAVLLTGYFRGTADFGGGPMSVPFVSDLDAFVAKFDADGNPVWSKHFPNTGNDRAYGIATDPVGNVAVAGTFSNTIDLGGGELTSANAMIDIFVVKLNAAGGYVWGRQIGTAGASEGTNGVAMDGSGNVIITGNVIASVDFGGGSLAGGGSVDAYVAKYAAQNGNHLWSRRVVGSGNDYGAAVAVDSAGNVAIAGSFNGSALFSTFPLTSFGVDDAYVMKLDAAGTVQWARQLGGTTSDVGLSLAFTPSGSLVTAGYFYGSGSFGGFPLTSLGAADAFVASLAP
jgi:PKD repeat protein